MKNRSRTDYSILNIVAGLGGYAINTLVGLVCRMVFTRTLAAEYLGVNGLFTNILSMLSLTELGIGTAIVYALYKPLAENDKDKIATLVQFYGKCYRIIGIVVAVIGVALTPFLELLIDQQGSSIPNITVIYLLFLFNSASTYFFSYRSSLLIASQRSYLVLGLNYLITIIQSVLQIILLFATHNYMGYLWVQTGCTLLNNILISFIAQRQFPFIAQKDAKSLSCEEKNSLTKNVWALTVWKLSGLLVNQTDSIIITFFSGLTTVGLSSNYTLLSTTLNTLLGQVFSSISSSIGNHNALETTEHKINLFRTINLANFWLFGWASIGIALVSSDVVAVLFGKEYILHWSIPLVMALNFYTVGMQNAVWTYNNTLGLFRQGRYLLLVTAALNLILSFVLGKVWGLFGILLATFIARLFTNLWYDPYKLFKYGFNTSVKEYALQYLADFLIITVEGSICWALCSLTPRASWWTVLYKFLICSIISNAGFWLCFRKKAEFLYLKELVWRVIRRIRGLIFRGK